MRAMNSKRDIEVSTKINPYKTASELAADGDFSKTDEQTIRQDIQSGRFGAGYNPQDVVASAQKTARVVRETHQELAAAGVLGPLQAPTPQNYRAVYQNRHKYMVEKLQLDCTSAGGIINYDKMARFLTGTENFDPDKIYTPDAQIALLRKMVGRMRLVHAMMEKQTEVRLRDAIMIAYNDRVRTCMTSPNMLQTEFYGPYARTLINLTIVGEPELGVYVLNSVIHRLRSQGIDGDKIYNGIFFEYIYGHTEEEIEILIKSKQDSKFSNPEVESQFKFNFYYPLIRELFQAEYKKAPTEKQTAAIYDHLASRYKQLQLMWLEGHPDKQKAAVERSMAAVTGK